MSDQTLSTAQLDALLVRGSDEGFVRSEDVRELTEALELDARDLDELNAIFASHGRRLPPSVPPRRRRVAAAYPMTPSICSCSRSGATRC
jgi:hypothetical protein